MKLLFSLYFLASIFGGTFISAEKDWCYDDAEGCGPSTPAWPKLCHDGKNQSPIDIPNVLIPSGSSNLRLQGYKGDSFRLQNNGHSLYVDFIGESGSNEGPTSKLFPFPDAGKASGFNQNQQEIRQYKFLSAHFHWGRNDSEGSEHCLNGVCSAMEIHFVHYLSNYSSFAEARDSGNPNALAVLGVLIDPSPSQEGSSSSTLATLINNFGDVQQGRDGEWVSVKGTLDFTSLLHSKNNDQVYTYKGSLTTPGCNEVVNWYVLRRPGKVSKDDLKAFRTRLFHADGKPLDHNWRPVQPRNNRKVFLSAVKASQ